MDAAGNTIPLTEGNHIVRSFHGDIIEGGAGDDTIFGGHGWDKIIGGEGVNTIYGDGGEDFIDAGTGAAQIFGGGDNDTIFWNYAPLSGGTLAISGGAGDEDILDVTVEPTVDDVVQVNADTIRLAKTNADPGDTKAALTVNGDTLSLDLIENLSLDAGQEGDGITVDDLLDTTIQTVDLQLGSSKAKMWQADRDADGNYQVYSAEFEAFAGDPAVRQADYFYRYDLDEDGSYLFREDGTPVLQEVVFSAEIQGGASSNSVQRLWLDEGLDRVNLFYGFDDALPQSGRTLANSVEIRTGMSGSEIEGILESLSAVTDVTVTGSGTQTDPWEVTFLAATTNASGTFRHVAVQYDVQAFSGSLSRRDDTRVFQRFYRLTDPEAEYLFNPDGTPALVSATDSAQVITGNRVQLLSLAFFENGPLWYGDESITLENDTSAQVLEERLEELPNITNVTVTGSGTDIDPWQIEFVEAEFDVNGDFFLLALESGRTSAAADQAVFLETWQDHARLIYNGQGAEITDETSAAEVAEALESLPSIRDVHVGGEGSTDSPWHVAFVDADIDSAGVPHVLEREVSAQQMTRQLDVVISDNLNEQFIPKAAIAEGTIINYGITEITLAADDIKTDPADQATQLQERLRTIPDLAYVTINYDGVNDEFVARFPAAEERISFNPGTGFQEARTEEANLQQQWIDKSAISSDTVIRYLDHEIALRAEDIVSEPDETGDQSGKLQARLREIAGLEAVTVNYDPGIDAYQVRFAVATQTLAVSADSGLAQVRAAQQTTGFLRLPLDLSGAKFEFSGKNVDIDLSSAIDANGFTAALEALETGTDIVVTGSGGINDPWEVNFFGYDDTQPITVTYGLDGLTALAGNASASFQIIERLADDNIWSIETGDTGQYAVFGTDSAVGSTELYISAYQTVEREVPRLLEKPIYADLDGDGLLEETDQTDFFEDPTFENDRRVDTVSIFGSWERDDFRIGHEVLTTGPGLEEIQTDTVQVTHQRLDALGQPDGSNAVVITIRGLDLDDPDASVLHDEITIDARSGADRIRAGLVPNSTELAGNQVISARAVDNLTLIGGMGADRIIGTPFADTLDPGEGHDIVTGNEGVDTFVDSFTDLPDTVDTLIEARDLNFSLSDVELAITGETPSTVDPTLTVSVDEREDVILFERFSLFGGAHDNRFAVTDFTQQAHLDGTEGSDTYVLTLSGTISGQSSVFVNDSGTGSIDSDTVEIRGGDSADTLHLDADTSRQQVVRQKSGSFQLLYQDKPTVDILDSDGHGEVEAKLEALSGIRDVTVSGSGTAADPWLFEILDADTNPENTFFRITSSDESIAEARVARATVSRIPADLTATLLAGKPDLDALFERPANETQIFNLLANRTGTFELTYNGKTTEADLSETSTAVDIELALEALSSLGNVTVTGEGTSRDPWQVKILDGDQDGSGNFFRLEVNKKDLVSDPLDIADAAATTRPSLSLSDPANFQRVYYDFTAENVTVSGGAGSDTFISDDSMAAVFVYGDQGNDNFLIGRVLKTKVVEIDGRQVEVVDGTDGLTAGVSFNGFFFGGSGDDYFEVNHNVGELQLFGESGDDTFFLKAQLQEKSGGVEEIDGGQILAGAGDEQNNVDDTDTDVLIDYVENNRVEIFGGSGFDTVVVAGTTLDDEFYIFADNEGQQFLYGAGLKLENIAGIERLALVTGAGDDTVYLYGLTENLSLLVNLGSGNDRLIVGGGEETFQVTYPAASAVYTVEQQILRDVFQYEARQYNDVMFERREMDDQKRIEAFREFYNKWFNGVSSVTIDPIHWRLLETNLALALKLYAQGVEFAVRTPIYGTTLNIGSYKNYSTFGQLLSAWYERNAYIGKVDRLEQALLSASSPSQNQFYQEWGQNYHDGDFEVRFSAGGPRPILPDMIAFDTLVGIVPDSRLKAGPNSLDSVFYWHYMRPVVGYTIWGDHIQSDQVRRGTGRYSPRIDNWGYEPDLYKGDLYSAQVRSGGGNLRHIPGEKQVWIPGNYTTGRGAELFWDLTSLFYDVQTPQNVDINVEQNFKAKQEAGAASYRFDNLPERTVEKILPANYDIDRIAGVVRLAGGAGNDIIEINARDGAGANVTVTNQVLSLADFDFDTGALAALPAGVTQDDVQAALVRANKETDIGVLDRLAGNEIAATDVAVSIEETVRTFTLREPVDTLAAEVFELSGAGLLDSEQVEYNIRLEAFVFRGQQILGDGVSSTADFSLDALDGLLNDTVLAEMIASGEAPVSAAAKDVKTALSGLRNFLTLISVNTDLRGDGFIWTGDTALKIYQQNSPDITDRTAVYRYTQEIWNPATYDDAVAFNSSSGRFGTRLDPRAEEDVKELTDNDLNNARSSRRLQEIRYTIDGQTYHVGGTGTPLAGNTIELEKAYVPDRDNLDQSYYTYAYFGADSSGNPALESVAIRRLNDTDPNVNALVGGKDALEGGVYLTADNWSNYVEQLHYEQFLDAAQKNAFKFKTFTETNVQDLIQTAFTQTLRNDVTAPIRNGLQIDKGGIAHRLDIQAIQDDAGFFLPEEIAVQKTTVETVTVGADYVIGRKAGTEYSVTYDSVVGLNPYGIWFGGIEQADLGINETLSSAAGDAVTIERTQFLALLNVATGFGSDQVKIENFSADTFIETGRGSDTLTVFDGFGDGVDRGAVLTLDGGGNGDTTILNLGRNTDLLVNVQDSGNLTGDTQDELILNGTDAPDTVVLESDLDPADSSAGQVSFGTGVDLDRVYFRGQEFVTINTLGEQDTITIESTPMAEFTVNTGAGDDAIRVKAISGNTEINGGIGVDVIDVGNDELLLDDINAVLTVNDAGAEDVLNVLDLFDLDDEAGSLTDQSIVGLGMGPGRIDYGTVALLNIFLGQGSDSFFILDTHVNTVTNLSSNFGDDTITIGAISGETSVLTGGGRDIVNVGNDDDNLHGILGELSLYADTEGLKFSDVLNITDAGDAVGRVGTLTRDTVSGFGMLGRVFYEYFEEINLTLGTGSDTLTVGGTIAGVTNVRGGKGRDDMTIEAVDGVLNVQGNEGSDTFTVFDEDGGTAGADAFLTLDGGLDDDTTTLNL